MRCSFSKKYFRPGGKAPSEPSATPQWRITPHPVSIPRVALHIALQSLFHRFFSLCRSPILIKHSGVGANCDHTWEWVHWVHACIWNAMGDVAKTSPRVPSICAQNAILSLLIIHLIPSRKIYVAINNPSLVPSISCLTPSSYLSNYVRAADHVSDAENLRSNSCQCFSHLYKFRDGIQVTRVFRYCGERQG
jgi:hypothetical protein